MLFIKVKKEKGKYKKERQDTKGDKRGQGKEDREGIGKGELGHK